MVLIYGLFVFPVIAEPVTPAADPNRWQLTFEDHFNGTSLDASKWEAATENRQGGKSAWNPNQVSVSDGFLRLGITKVVDPETGEIIRYDCGAVRGREGYSTVYKFKQKYGYYEARYKLPANINKDYWASFWLMAGPVISTTETKVGMEIDIMESFTLARQGTNSHTANFHWAGYGDLHNKASIVLRGPSDDWAKNTMLNPAGEYHVYGFYWDQDVYVFYLDGIEIGRTNMVGIGDNVTKPDPPNPTKYPTFLANGTTQNEGYMLLSCEAATWAGRAGWEVDAPVVDAFYVDYVRIYDLKPKFVSDPFTGSRTTESAPYQESLAGMATDANGGTLAFAKVSGPSWLSVATDGALTGTPSSSDVGLNSFEVSVSDGISTVQSTLQITVRSFFNQWAANENLTFSGDANQDHVPDGLAWLLGASLPSEKANGRLPIPLRSAEGGLVLNFRSLKASKRGAATLSLQFSSDLGQTDPWSNLAIPETSGTDPVTGVIFTITANGDYNDVQAATPANAAGEGGKLFSRLMAIGTP